MRWKVCGGGKGEEEKQMADFISEERAFDSRNILSAFLKILHLHLWTILGDKEINNTWEVPHSMG